MASDGTAKLYRNQGGTHLASGTVKCFTVGKWHHVVLTLDANRNAVAYVNGYPVVSTTYASAILPGLEDKIVYIEQVLMRRFESFSCTTLKRIIRYLTKTNPEISQFGRPRSQTRIRRFEYDKDFEYGTRIVRETVYE